MTFEKNHLKSALSWRVLFSVHPILEPNLFYILCYIAYKTQEPGLHKGSNLLDVSLILPTKYYIKIGNESGKGQLIKLVYIEYLSM